MKNYGSFEYEATVYVSGEGINDPENHINVSIILICTYPSYPGNYNNPPEGPEFNIGEILIWPSENSSDKVTLEQFVNFYGSVADKIIDDAYDAAYRTGNF